MEPRHKASFLPPSPAQPTAPRCQGATVTFQWSGGAGVSAYTLNVSAIAPGDYELYNRNVGTATSATVCLPTKSHTVYVHLWSQNASTGKWEANLLHLHRSHRLCARHAHQPGNGSTLAAASVTFQWSSSAGASAYSLNVSAKAPGGELYNQNVGTITSVTVSGLPTNGGTLYVDLGSQNASSSAWTYSNNTYTAYTVPPPTPAFVPATMISPTNGSTLPVAIVTFQWTPGAGVSNYWLCVTKTLSGGECSEGPGSVGTGEIYNVDQNSLDEGTTILSHTLAGLPTDGSTLYVILSSLNATGWTSNTTGCPRSGSSTHGFGGGGIRPTSKPKFLVSRRGSRGNQSSIDSMTFTSPTFLVFLVLVFCAYWHLECRGQNLLIVLASLVFYGWWDWHFLFLLLSTAGIDYLTSRGMMGSAKPRVRKGLLAVSVAANVLTLGFFKYFNFFLASTESVLHALGFAAHPAMLRIVLRLGSPSTPSRR
jgi:hypothetical protein